MTKASRQTGLTRKITFSLPAKAAARLDDLQETIEAPTASEVLRHALRCYELAIKARREGGDVIVRDRDGRETSIFLH